MVDTDRTIVFVEVKTRTNEDFADAEGAITVDKQAKLSKAARYFIATNDVENRAFRFDIVIAILGRAGPVQIRHYKNAFAP